MDYSEITFNRWKNLNKIFYSNGVHTLRMYENGDIELTNVLGKLFKYEVLSNHNDGNRIAYSIRNLNSDLVGSLTLTSNRVAILLFENGRGLKLKKV